MVLLGMNAAMVSCSMVVKLVHFLEDAGPVYGDQVPPLNPICKIFYYNSLKELQQHCAKTCQCAKMLNATMRVHDRAVQMIKMNL